MTENPKIQNPKVFFHNILCFVTIAYSTYSLDFAIIMIGNLRFTK